MSIKHKNAAQRSAECWDATMKKLNGFPYTVILKSGVKVGVSEEIADKLYEDVINGTISHKTANGVFVKISQIAAIVPTENITI